jgi:hypothetical protein
MATPNLISPFKKELYVYKDCQDKDFPKHILSFLRENVKIKDWKEEKYHDIFGKFKVSFCYFFFFTSKQLTDPHLLISYIRKGYPPL